MRWIDEVISALKTHEAICLVVISRTQGSSPRETGAVMLVSNAGLTSGTIGGGALEYDAIHHAQDCLEKHTQAKNASSQTHRSWRDYPLGPSLGQCCGGFVSVMFEAISKSALPHWQEIATHQTGYVIHPHRSEDAAFFAKQVQKDQSGFAQSLKIQTTPLYLYGAGHVGRAVIAATTALPLTRHWIDIEAPRFPAEIPQDVEKIIAATPQHIAPYAPHGTIHLVMTHDHQIDLNICAEILTAKTASHIGLIGSKTKRTRFQNRLSAMGFSSQQINLITCPIGLDAIHGKDPARVALSIAAQLANWTYQKQNALDETTPLTPKTKAQNEPIPT